MKETSQHKYQKLKEYIINTIKSNKLKPGDRIYSENELAHMFNISRHTVRQAIGELVNSGWLYRVQGKGTFVDRRPDKNHHTNSTIGIITTYLNDYIFPSIIRGIDEVLSSNGYNIILGCTYNQHDKEKICLENFKKQNIAGLIVETTKSVLPNPNIEVYRELSNEGIPVLFIHGRYKELNYSYIVEDDEKAGYIATKHLIDLGHKEIAGIFKIDDIQGHFRFKGFQKAHTEFGLKYSDSKLLWFNTGQMDANFVDNKFLEVLSNCSAVVCYNDQIAIKVMDIIRQNGFNIPNDISVVSFDDSQLAVASEVKLTTVAHPKEALGKQAGEAIIDMVNRKKNYYGIKMQPELIIRESTKCI